MSEARHSIAELIEELQEGDFQTRNAAAVSLGELGPEARESVPPLTRSLEAEDKYLRAHAAAALGKIGPDARTAVPALARALKDKEEDVRGEAAAALGHIGAESKSAVSDLVELLKDERKPVRRQAATALKMIDPEIAAHHIGFFSRLAKSSGGSAATMRAVNARGSARRSAPTWKGLVEPGSGSMSGPEIPPAETKVAFSNL